MERDTLAVHKGENCPQRIVTCEFCEFPLPAIDLAEHQVIVDRSGTISNIKACTLSVENYWLFHNCRKCAGTEQSSAIFVTDTLDFGKDTAMRVDAMEC